MVNPKSYSSELLGARILEDKRLLHEPSRTEVEKLRIVPKETDHACLRLCQHHIIRHTGFMLGGVREQIVNAADVATAEHIPSVAALFTRSADFEKLCT